MKFLFLIYEPKRQLLVAIRNLKSKVFHFCSTLVGIRQRRLSWGCVFCYSVCFLFDTIYEFMVLWLSDLISYINTNKFEDI